MIMLVTRICKLLAPTVVVVLLTCAGTARADEAGAAEKAAAEVPLGMKARKTAEETFANIAKNAKCAPEAIADPEFFSDTAKAMRLYVHSEDASLIARNKRHVMMAYGAILALLIAFVVRLLFRQRQLSARIDELRAELEQAERD